MDGTGGRAARGLAGQPVRPSAGHVSDRQSGAGEISNLRSLVPNIRHPIEVCPTALTWNTLRRARCAPARHDSVFRQDELSCQHHGGALPGEQVMRSCGRTDPASGWSSRAANLTAVRKLAETYPQVEVTATCLTCVRRSEKPVWPCPLAVRCRHPEQGVGSDGVRHASGSFTSGHIGTASTAGSRLPGGKFAADLCRSHLGFAEQPGFARASERGRAAIR